MSRGKEINLVPVNSLAASILVDNYTDVLLPSTDAIIRPPLARDGKRLAAPLAEHGLSILVETGLGEGVGRVLLDAGTSSKALPHNAEILGVDLARVGTLVLSHGHPDHHGGLGFFLGLRRAESTVVLTHPDAFRTKYNTTREGKRIELPNPDQDAILRTGAKLVVTREPSCVAVGLITTGEVERVTDFEKGQANLLTERDGEICQDPVLDDQALIGFLAGKGLVIIAGCAHAGIINTIRHAQEITGIDRVFAVIGGFHLTGASESVIQQTVMALQELAPRVLVPAHCTGWNATNCIAQALPESFVLSSVGTSIRL